MAQQRSTDFSQAHPVWSAINGLLVKVLPPIIVAGIIGGFAGGIAMYQKISSISESIPRIDASLSRLEDKQQRQEGDIVVLRSQMVGWDVMKRIEFGLNSASREGKGNAAMGAVATALRAEIEARKEKQYENDRR